MLVINLKVLLATSQLVRYSENYTELLDATESANETQVVYGTLGDVEAGTFIFVYVAAPYNPGKNIYFAVEITVNDDQKVRSKSTLTAHKISNKVLKRPNLADSFAYNMDRAKSSQICFYDS